MIRAFLFQKAQGQGNHNPTLYDLIQTDDTVIMNCLIDQAGIESIVMFKDKKEARNVMIDHPPKNCKTVRGHLLVFSKYDINVEEMGSIL